MDKKVVLISGASRGIGAAIAMHLASLGYKVIGTARSEFKFDKPSDNLIPLKLDITCRESIKNCAAKLKEQNLLPDILINNAGIAVSKSSLNTSMEDWDNVMNTNLRGVFMCSKLFSKHLVDNKKSGKIINISSIAAEKVLGHRLSSYCASKAAVSHLTRTLANEYAKYNIQVNAIAPGYILTDLNKSFFDTDEGKEMIELIPQKRIGFAEELDGALLLLCSDAGSFMTGSIIRVDGGHVIG